MNVYRARSKIVNLDDVKAADKSTIVQAAVLMQYSVFMIVDFWQSTV